MALLYDVESRAIGVKFPVWADRHFFRVRLYGRGGCMRIVRAARLLKQFDIRVEQTLCFKNVPVVYFREEEPMLLLELDNGQKLV